MITRISDVKYRYTLIRDLSLEAPGLFAEEQHFTWNRVLFCMLNPSTATETKNDPTVRRCIGFAERWKARELCVVNLFAARSTDPKALKHMDDPVGPMNNDHIAMEAKAADMVVAAWGTHGTFLDRGQRVLEILAAENDVFALEITKEGFPKHPLYVAGDIEPCLLRAKVSG